MTAKLAIICSQDKFSARLQAWGEEQIGRKSHPMFPYHCAWLVGDTMFDMSWKFREIPADKYKKRDVAVFNSPVEITEDYLRMMVGKRSYGAVDVALYPILTPLGLNFTGTHCAEAINDDLWFHGYRTPFLPYGAPPSPADLLYWAFDTLTLEGIRLAGKTT